MLLLSAQEQRSLSSSGGKCSSLECQGSLRPVASERTGASCKDHVYLHRHFTSI